MDPRSPSEAQQRFMAAQHLMVTRIKPSSHQERRVQTQQHHQQQQYQQQQLTRETTSSHSKRKRGRGHPSLPTATASVSPSTRWLLPPKSAEAPRKTAHELQKEYRQDLVREARELEQTLERMRLEAGVPTQADRQELLEARHRNAEIEHSVYETTRFEVQLLALATEQLQSPPVNQLWTFIHMPCDQSRRRAILRGMKDVKLRRAAEVGIERFRHLEANASYLSEERFTTEKDGAFHCNRWEINAFPQFQSAKQLYDALLFWLYNLEISVTEMVDQIALREDNEEIEPTIWNHRMIIQSEDVGCTEELNMVAFARFYEGYDLMDGKPLGVIAYDTVDVDDLYPYKPLERTRKDVQSFHLINEVVDPITQKKSVVLKSCYLNAQLPPQFPVEPRVIQKLHEYMSRWAVVIVQYLRDYAVPT